MDKDDASEGQQSMRFSRRYRTKVIHWNHIKLGVLDRQDRFDKRDELCDDRKGNCEEDEYG